MDEEPIRVMVVDDHPMWRDAVERDLAGGRASTWSRSRPTATEALARFPAARPQVVVLDLQIPAPNGVEVTAEVLAARPRRARADPLRVGEQADVLDAVKAGRPATW